MKKKITFVIPSIGFGGAEIQLLWQIQGLKDKGYEAYLIVTGDIDEKYKDLPIDEAHLLCLNGKNKTLTGSAALETFKHIPKIGDFIKMNGLTVVIANLPFSHLIMRLVKIYLKAKKFHFNLINYHHSLQFEESPLNTLVKKIFNIGNSGLARFTDNANIFISDAVMHNIQDTCFIKNGHIIYNGIPGKSINIDEIQNFLNESKIPYSEYRIVIPGRLNETKGQLFFIKAFAKFVHSLNLKPSKIQVILAGGGNLKDQIESEIAKLGLKDYFFITGFIPNDILLGFMRISDLVAIPSLVEGLGNVAIEALMMGSTILASDAGGLKEIIKPGENGFGFERNNEADLLSKLGFLYGNRSEILLDKNKVNQDFKNRFSFETHLLKLEEVINSFSV